MNAAGVKNTGVLVGQTVFDQLATGWGVITSIDREGYAFVRWGFDKNSTLMPLSKLCVGDWNSIPEIGEILDW